MLRLRFSKWCRGLQATLHRRFFASDFDGLARLRLEDFYFGPATPNLLSKPGASLGVAVAEDECARLHLADQFQQGLAVGVRG